MVDILKNMTKRVAAHVNKDENARDVPIITLELSREDFITAEVDIFRETIHGHGINSIARPDADDFTLLVDYFGFRFRVTAP